jgi:hypothetical protein
VVQPLAQMQTQIVEDWGSMNFVFGVPSQSSISSDFNLLFFLIDWTWQNLRLKMQYECGRNDDKVWRNACSTPSVDPIFSSWAEMYLCFDFPSI